jgi:ribosome maturation factor RimP
MSTTNIIKTVTDLAEPVANQSGLELVDVTFRKEGGRFMLRVFIDKPEGVTVDDCEFMSKKLSVLLDEVDPIGPSYYLEVSSPGLDRPLKKGSDFERFKGRNVTIHTFAPIAGRKRFTGILGGIKDNEVQLDLGADGMLSIPRQDISQARLVAEISWEGLK